MSKCPNKNLNDFKVLVNELGEQEAYSVFMQNDGKVPYLQSREQNHYLWKVENKYGLNKWDHADNQVTKTPIPFSIERANELVRDIEEEYVGDFVVYANPVTEEEATVHLDGYPIPASELTEMYPNESINEAITKYKAFKDYEFEQDNGTKDILPKDKPSFSIYKHPRIVEPNNRFEELKNTLLSNMPKVIEVVEDNELPVPARLLAGGKKIVINPILVTETSLGHEFGHILIDLRGGLNNAFILEGIEQLKGTELWAKTASKYPNISPEQLGKEVLAEAIGIEVSDLFQTPEPRNIFAKWLTRFYKWLGSRTGIDKNNAKELARELLDDEGIDENSLTGVPADYDQDQEIDLLAERPEEEVEDLEGFTEIKDKFYSIRESAIQIATSKLATEERLGNTIEIEDLQHLVTILTDKRFNDKVAILSFVDNAVKGINSAYTDYRRRLEFYENGDVDYITPKQLLNWYNVASAYSMLDGISIDIMKGVYSVEGIDAGVLQEIKKMLDGVIDKKNELLNIHEDLGTKVFNDSVSDYHNKIVMKVRYDKLAEGREKFFPKFKNRKIDRKEYDSLVNEYADNFIKENALAINKLSIKSLRGEMYQATEADISIMERMFGTILDTKDALTGTLVRKFVAVDHDIRKGSIDFKVKTLELVEKLEEQLGYDQSTVPSEFYSFMLERDSNGKLTGNVAAKVSSMLLDAFTDYKAEQFDLANDEQQTVEEAYIAIDKWVAENMPEDGVAKREAFADFTDKLKMLGTLTDGELLLYISNENAPKKYKRGLSSLNINQKGLQALIDWKHDNKYTFIKPAEKWITKEWKALEKIRENKNDARTKFYDHIMTASSASDSRLPQSLKIKNRLPFLRKDTREILLEKGTVKEAAIEKYKKSFQFRHDEVEYGSAFLDRTGKPIDFIPVNYIRPKSKVEEVDGKEVVTPQYDVKDQSFDIATLYNSYNTMSLNYAKKLEIMPTMEYAKIVMHNRKMPMAGKAVQLLNDNKLTRKITKTGESQLETMWNSFLKADLYGQSKVKESLEIGGKEYNWGKVLDFTGKYAAMNLLAGNVHQAIANVTLGETTQILEAMAGEYYTMESMRKASAFYFNNTVEMLGDIGERMPKNVVNLLNEEFDILNEYDDGKFREKSKFANLCKTSTLYFTAHAGEHFMQTRVMLAMLASHKAVDKDGNDLGSMLDNYYNEGHRLVLNPKVDLAKSQWLDGTDGTVNQQALFGAKVKRLLASMHGEYGNLGKNEIQRYAVGRMAIMFRKFIVPGALRRWQGKRPNYLLENYTEGYYRTGINFLQKSFKELHALGISAFTENYDKLSQAERKNIHRLITEFSFMFGFSILAGVLFAFAGKVDDDDELAMAAILNGGYVADRVRKEYLFFYSPLTIVDIMRSPVATMSVINNLSTVFSQLMPFSGERTFIPEGFDEYKRGNWKGKKKLNKSIMRLVPVIKQAYKVRDIEDILKAMNIETSKE
jgi:hypothetical protein